MPKDAIAHVAYDGPALVEGSMDVRELAPALLAIGDLLQSANRTLNGDRAALSVHVQTDFKGGSFEISFGLVMTAAVTLHSFMASESIKTAREVAEYVGLVTGVDMNLLAFLKWLKGRPPTSATTLSSGDIHITVNVNGDNNETVVRPQVYLLAQDLGVRKAVADTVKPLRQQGIDTFEVRKPTDGVHVVTEQITRDDLPALEGAQVETSLAVDDSTSTRIALLEVVKPSFKPGLRWRFSDGSGGRVSALLKDTAFESRVQNGARAFAK